MTKGELLRNSFKYLCCSIIAWDEPNRKTEDNPYNANYFFSEKYKKEFCSPVDKIRKMSKISYFANKNTSTNFNVIEIGDEVIFAFRGSDSKQDWLSDFNFFKVKFENTKNYINEVLKPELSEEEYNTLVFEEYMKGEEGLNISEFFKNNALISPFVSAFNGENSFVNLFTKLKKNNEENKTEAELTSSFPSNFIVKAIEKSKDLVFHKGFFLQFNSVVDILETEVSKYVDSDKKITFCGHSLGAPLAKLGWLVSCLKHPEIFQRSHCYIFGTPKLGNKALNELFDNLGKDNRLVVTNIASDLVKTVPPENLGYPNPKDDIIIKPIKAPFKTKFDHTLFYYLYCFRNKAPVEFNKK